MRKILNRLVYASHLCVTSIWTLSRSSPRRLSHPRLSSVAPRRQHGRASRSHLGRGTCKLRTLCL